MAESKTLGLSKERAELLSTIILSIAAILVAWTSFQAGKWGGVQAIAFSEAGASRVESTRWDTAAGQQIQVDVAVYTEWLSAVDAELDEGIDLFGPEGEYLAPPGQLSSFLYDRMRDEFRPALDAWLAEGPIENPDAPKTPFEMDAYELAARAEAERYTVEAEASAQQARDANQTGDTYVLTTVLFAAVLFFAGIASKLDRQWSRSLALFMAILFVVVGVYTISSLPIELGDELFFLN